MRIALVGKFTNMYDEEYIARSFESLGHYVMRIPQDFATKEEILVALKENAPIDILLYTKWQKVPKSWELKSLVGKTVCWLFDLYFNYDREYLVRNAAYFRSDFVFTTDGGHDADFAAARVNHHCVRQGIFEDECFVVQPNDPKGIVFIGSENPMNMDRTKELTVLYGQSDFTWIGRRNTHELRGRALNELYATVKIVVGSSVYSPYYWSNRVVETLGRGGFLIHQDVPGLKEEFPFLITYPRGDFRELNRLIAYYSDPTHEHERLKIIFENYQHVRARYTMKLKCQELIDIIQNETTR